MIDCCSDQQPPCCMPALILEELAAEFRRCKQLSQTQRMSSLLVTTVRARAGINLPRSPVQYPKPRQLSAPARRRSPRLCWRRFSALSPERALDLCTPIASSWTRRKRTLVSSFVCFHCLLFLCGAFFFFQGGLPQLALSVLLRAAFHRWSLLPQPVAAVTYGRHG